jgi:septum formation protein
MTDRKLILASASPRRNELLRLLGIPFEVVPSAYEEVMPERHPDPAALAVHLASEKARDVSRARPGEWVLGADTIVALKDRLYGKPKEDEDARWMLRGLSGKTHQVVTGVCFIEPGGTEHTLSASTDVRFRELLEPEIQAYVESGEPLDKAGAYAIQGIGGLLIEGIRGDYPNVVGLPIAPLALLLRRCGFLILRVAS